MPETEPFLDGAHTLEEPITITGISATYDCKINLGTFESLNPAMTVWVKTNIPEGAAYDLHDCKNRLRQMARDNVRAQLQRLQGNNEVVFLGLRLPASGSEEPVSVHDVVSACTNIGLSSGLLPPNTLFWKQQGERPVIGIYVPARRWRVQVESAGGDEVRTYHIPMPSLVFVGHGNAYQIYAVKRRPRDGHERLYHTPSPVPMSIAMAASARVTRHFLCARRKPSRRP
jgi:hypothetical protein